MKWLKVFCQVLLFDIALLAAMGSAQAAQVELRVLLVAYGNTSVDNSRLVMENLLTSLRVPYEVIDTSTQTITKDMLETTDGTRGYFNGIILTDVTGNWNISLAEFQLLHQYERDFGVREAVMSGWPINDIANYDLDYGMSDVQGMTVSSGLWQSPAGGTEIFEYVNTANPLPTTWVDNKGLTQDTLANIALPRTITSSDPRISLIETLLVPAGGPLDYGMIFRITYIDGRKVLLCTLDNGNWLLHSSVLAYEFLNFATSGLFIGAHHVYLEAHSDDLFIADDVWNPATHSLWPEDGIHAPYRLGASEFIKLAAALKTFWVQHPLASKFNHRSRFQRHRNKLQRPADHGRPIVWLLLWLHQPHLQSRRHGWVFRCSPTAWKCTLTPYSTVYNEINKNAAVWKNLRLPGYQYATSELLTGEYSGLSDPWDSKSFPDGFNPALGQAASALGVRMLASDSSLQIKT